MKIDKKVLRFFSALSDETRLKILTSLAEGEKTVGNIHRALGEKSITLPAVSHQLKQLEQIDLVYFRKNGREKIYNLSGDYCWCTLKNTVKHFKSKGGNKNEKSKNRY